MMHIGMSRTAKRRARALAKQATMRRATRACSGRSCPFHAMTARNPAMIAG
jgi:hypothetical protein